MLSFRRTSGGIDVFLNGQFVGTIVSCPVLDCVFYRTRGTYVPFKTSELAVCALSVATDRALADGAV